MDPLTIIASVAATSRAVTTISTTLVTFIRDTKQVDQTVDALLREVNSLKRTIRAIKDVIQQTATQAVILQDQECNLANSIHDSLVDCRTTLESLDRNLREIEVKNPSRNPFRQAVKQIKVNWNSGEFRTLRGQMHSHCLSMQLALQTINVHIATKGPGTVVGSLGPKIDKLNDTLAKMEMNALQQVGGKRGAQPEPASTGIAASLMESANKVVSNASDKMGSTNRSGSEPIQAFDTASESSQVQSKSHPGTRQYSAMSYDSLSTGRRKSINEWKIRVDRDTRSEPGSTPSPPFPRRKNRPRPGDKAASPPFDIPTIPEDIEADGDIKLELIQSMIKIALGNLSFAQSERESYSNQQKKCKGLEHAFRRASNTLGNVLYKKLASRETLEDHHRTVQLYKEHLAAREQYRRASQELGTCAERGLKLALTETAKLTPARSEAIDLQEIRLNLAFAYEVREKWERAESLFRMLADSGVQGEADTALMLRACQALAALFLQQGRLDEADGFCRRALLGRRRIFGKEHAMYRESMLLNIEICRAQGQTEIADAYMAALPPDPNKSKAGVREERRSRSRGSFWSSPPTYRSRARSMSSGRARSGYAYA